MKLTLDTDIMFDKMKNVLPNLMVVGLDSPFRFAEVITETIVMHSSKL